MSHKEINYMSAQDISRILEGLEPGELESIITDKFKSLSPDAKKRVLGLSDSGITVVTGSFVSLNSDIAINFQNSSSGFDAEALMKALAEFHKYKSKNS